MAIYCIDDGGDGSQTNTTQSASTLDWSKADTSIANLISYDAEAFTTSGNIIYFGDDTADPNKAASWTLTGPTSGLPVILISADRTASTPTYKVGTGNQLSSLGGAYTLTLDGSFACYGLKFNSGEKIVIDPDQDETAFLDACTFIPASAQSVGSSSSGAANSCMIYTNCTFDFSSSTVGTSTACIVPRGICQISNCTVTGMTNRTGALISCAGSTLLRVFGLDMSTAASTLELFAGGVAYEFADVSNVKLPATFAGFIAANYTRNGCYFASNCSNVDDPAQLSTGNYLGRVLSSSPLSTAIYRTGGATAESAATSWLITTTSVCGEQSPFYTPWIYGTISSTGSKTFDLYVTNDTADLTNAECWLEVEYLATSDVAKTAMATDQRSPITATAAAQTDDTTSTWNGTGPSFTYKQKLSVTATVNETGQYRARVAVGKASIASSAYFYVDPKVTVS